MEISSEIYRGIFFLKIHLAFQNIISLQLFTYKSLCKGLEKEIIYRHATN